MTTAEFILARKLSLVRAAYLRFGPAWSTEVRRAGIQLFLSRFLHHLLLERLVR